VASQFAHNLRHRSLLLPWDTDYYKLATDASGVCIAPSKQVCYAFLRLLGEWGGDVGWTGRRRTTYFTKENTGLCFFCKRRTRIGGLHYHCSDCVEIFAKEIASDPVKNDTYTDIFLQSLEFASQKWELPILTKQESLTPSTILPSGQQQALTLETPQKHSLSPRESLLIRLTKLTGG